MIKVGQIGIGHNHGEAKMKAFRKFPELFEVIGWAEENEEWVRRRGDLPGYQDLPRLSVDEVIEKSDAVIIETDVWNLTEVAQKCIDAGKHIHLDKPASGTLEEYKHLLDTAKEKGLIIQLGYMYRYNSAIQDMFRRIENGEMGEIFSINAEMSTNHPAAYRKWLCNFGGGIMYILGSHLIDLAVYLLGKPKKVHAFLKHSGMDGIDLPDNDLAVLEYDKAIVRIFVSSVEVNGYGRRQFVVCGSKGTASALPIEAPVTMTWSDHSIASKTYANMCVPVDVKDIPGNCRYDDMVQDFYAYVTGTKENPFTYEHEYAVQEVLDQVVGGIRFHGNNIR